MYDLLLTSIRFLCQATTSAGRRIFSSVSLLVLFGSLAVSWRAEAAAAPSNLTYVPGMTIGSDDGVRFWLGAQLIWQNNDPLASYMVVQQSTNNGNSWYLIPG